MTSKKKNYEEYMNEMDKFLSSKSDKDFIEIKAIAIQLDILNQVQELMDKLEMSRDELAKKMGVSKSFVSRIFSGDKMINLKMIAQFQEIFECNFITSFNPVPNYSGETHKISIVFENENESESYKKKD